MTSDELSAAVRDALGAQVQVRARRPGRIFQLSLPAYMDDGDGAAVYIKPLDDGRLEVTDLGRTTMRLSYTDPISEKNEVVLCRLADTHGFKFERGELTTIIRPADLLGSILGLIQVESEAEAAVHIATSRGERADSFHDEIRAALVDIFAAACKLDFTDESVDPKHDYAIDALIEGNVALGVSVVASELEAERAIVNKTKIEPILQPRRHRWVAVVRDQNGLSKRSNRRLVAEYNLAPPEHDGLAQRLRDLAA